MPNYDKWVISSSGNHMFISFNVYTLISKPGFTAKIHYGNKIKIIRIVSIKKHETYFSVDCENVINGEIGYCACHSCSELEGDCDFNDQCQEILKCGTNNCLGYFGFDTHTDCCYAAIVGDGEDGNKTLIIIFPAILHMIMMIFFQLLTESCAMNYCQDGLQVYFATETQTYYSIYGHYELQPNDVNGRPYFKMGPFGFWYDGLGNWWIGLDSEKGQSFGVAFYKKDVFCPHQLSEMNWGISNGTDWYIDSDGSDLVITCKCIFIQKQNIVSISC